VRGEVREVEQVEVHRRCNHRLPRRARCIRKSKSRRCSCKPSAHHDTCRSSRSTRRCPYSSSRSSDHEIRRT
jgi:hypothetical protein